MAEFAEHMQPIEPEAPAMPTAQANGSSSAREERAAQDVRVEGAEPEKNAEAAAHVEGTEVKEPKVRVDRVERKRRRRMSRQLFDFLLNLGMAASMTCIVCGGFHVAPVLQFNLFLLLGVSAIYLAAMFACGRSRLMVIIGGIAIAVGTIVALAVVGSVTGQADLMADIEGNPCIFLAISALVTIAVHVLSRTYAGSIALFALGALMAAIIQFLYRWDYVVLTMIFLACSVATVVFKYYHRAYAQADAKDTPRYGAAFAASLLTSVIVVAVGTVLFIGIDNLFHPQAVEIKPFKEYFAYEVVDITGIADATSVDNEDLTTSQTNDQQRPDDGNQDDNQDDSSHSDKNDQSKPTEGSMLTYTREALQDTFDVVTYGFDWWHPYLIAFLLVALIALVIGTKKFLRWRWHKQVLAKSPLEQVVEFYLFFLSRFERIGLGKPSAVTALGFAAGRDDSMELFEQNGGGVTLEELSQEYTRCAYGHCEPEPGAAERFDSFYRGFYKSCRKYVGRFKYLLKFFRL